MMPQSANLSHDDYIYVVNVTPRRLWGYPLTHLERIRKFKEVIQTQQAAGSMESYKEVRSYLHAMCTSYLRDSTTPTSQPDRVIAMLKKMRQNYPSFFGKDRTTIIKRLFLARTLIGDVHNYIRRSQRPASTGKGSKKNKSSHKTLSRASFPSSEKKQKTITSKNKALFHRCRDSTPVSSIFEEEEDVVIHSSSLPITQLAPPKSKTYESASTSQSAPAKMATQRPYLASSCPKPIHVSISNSNKGRRVANENVYHFLSTCRPPLVHLSFHFARYGCTTEEHLYRLGTWEKKFRYQRLKDMLNGVTEMEILFLEKHLDVYFGPVY